MIETGSRPRFGCWAARKSANMFLSSRSRGKWSKEPFCVPFDEGTCLPEGGGEPGNLSLTGGGWTCTIERLEGDGDLLALDLEPGSHLLFPQSRTIIRQGTLSAGRTVWRTRVRVSKQ